MNFGLPSPVPTLTLALTLTLTVTLTLTLTLTLTCSQKVVLRSKPMQPTTTSHGRGVPSDSTQPSAVMWSRVAGVCVVSLPDEG